MAVERASTPARWLALGWAICVIPDRLEVALRRYRGWHDQRDHEQRVVTVSLRVKSMAIAPKRLSIRTGGPTSAQ